MIEKKFNNKIINMVKAVVIPVTIFVIFGIATGGRTATMQMFFTTLRQAVIPIIICLGIILNMSVGMVNFSAGGMMLCAGIIGGNIALITNTGIAGIVVFSMIITFFEGALTGWLYKKLHVPCIVLTIGTMLVWEALPKVVFKSGINLTAKYTLLAKAPYCFILLGIVMVFFYIVYNKTAFGHNLRAIGANQSIANSVGLDSDKIKFQAFVLSGIFLGVAAFLFISSKGEVRNVSSMSSMTIMMDGFMGMFLAMFLSKYCDMTIAVIIGTFSMKMLSNGFVAAGLSATVRDLAQGLLLLVVLVISANAGLFERIKRNKEFAENANKEYIAVRQ